MFIERENSENEWFKCDGWGFVTCLKDAGLEQDQGDYALGLIVLTPKLKNSLEEILRQYKLGIV